MKPSARHLRGCAAGLLVTASAVVTLTGARAAAQGDVPPAVATRTVTVSYQPESEGSTLPIIDELAPETVLTVVATRFPADATATVVQCVHHDETTCTNRIEVRFDEDGRAAFQYLVSEGAASPAGDGQQCRLGQDRCTIEIRVDEVTTVVDTVFVDSAPPPGRIEVDPAADVDVGDTVTVTARDFPAGAELTVEVCAAPARRGSRCGSPGPVVPLTIGPDGRAEASMALDVDEVGTDRIACGRQVECRVVVVSDDVAVRAQPVSLSFRDRPGADYSPPRVLVGLALALGLVVVAAVLVRFANWDPPRESDSSAVDEAELADLDLEAARFTEHERALEGTRASGTEPRP